MIYNNLKILIAVVIVATIVQIAVSGKGNWRLGWVVPVVYGMIAGPYALRFLKVGPIRHVPDYYQAATFFFPAVWFLMIFFIFYYYRQYMEGRRR